MQPIYFQPKGINPKYCEVGIIHESDPNYIWYMYEPCKVLISEVKIIPKENVYYDKKSRESMIINLKANKNGKSNQRWKCCRASNLQIHWLPIGTAFKVEEYDGAESLRTMDDLCIIA